VSELISWSSRAMHAGVLAVATLAIAPVASHAQDVAPQTCQGGRIVTAATAGRCCWPGQAWSNERARCEGPPTCPVGLVASGDECTQEVTQLPPPPPSQPTVIYGQPGYGPPPGVYTPPPQEVDTGRTRPRLGLVISGAAMFGASYITSVFTGAMIMEAGHDDGAFLYIPAVGPLICAAACGSDDEPLAATLLVFDSLIQITGITLFALGFALQTPVYERAEIEGPQLAVAPWVTEDSAGLSLFGTNL
jgi:hypothetical protein